MKRKHFAGFSWCYVSSQDLRFQINGAYKMINTTHIGRILKYSLVAFQEVELFPQTDYIILEVNLW